MVVHGLQAVAESDAAQLEARKAQAAIFQQIQAKMLPGAAAMPSPCDRLVTAMETLLK